LVNLLDSTAGASGVLSCILRLLNFHTQTSHDLEGGLYQVRISQYVGCCSDTWWLIENTTQPPEVLVLSLDKTACAIRAWMQGTWSDERSLCTLTPESTGTGAQAACAGHRPYWMLVCARCVCVTWNCVSLYCAARQSSTRSQFLYAGRTAELIH
jgi:hypothetical protein